MPLAADLSKRLGSRTPQLLFENDAKLGALAEYAQFESRDVSDLLYLTGDVGVGAGIITSGKLLRGWSGFAGEVGHLPLDPERRPCNCGRTGCWETMVGLAAFLRRATTDDDDPVNDPGHPLAERMATLRSRADAGDEGTITALRAIASDLVSGLSILIDVLNPRAVVLGGYFAFFGEYLIGPVTAGLDARAMDAGSAALVTISRLGLLSAARGAPTSPSSGCSRTRPSSPRGARPTPFTPPAGPTSDPVRGHPPDHRRLRGRPDGPLAWAGPLRLQG